MLYTDSTSARPECFSKEFPKVLFKKEYMQEPLFGARKSVSDNFLFSRVTPLIKKINGLSDQLQNKDLEEFVIQETDCLTILDQLEAILEANQNLPRSQLNSLIFKQMLLPKLLNSMLIETINDLVQLARLLFLEFATDSLLDQQPISQTMVYLTALLVLSLLKTYFDSTIQRLVNLLLVRIRSILIYLIYTKSLRTQCFGSNKEDDETNYVANINTLITADIDEIAALQFFLQSIWQSFFIIALCLGYLYQKDSHAGTIVVFTMLVSQVFNLFVAKMMMVAEQVGLKCKDTRVGLTSDVIDGIKQIKYLSWEESFSEKIMRIRRKEFLMLAVRRVFDGFCSIFWNNISYVLLCAYIVSSLNNGKTLQNLNIFSLIAIFNTLTFPLGIIPWCINQFTLTWVSWKRIRDFLETKDIDTSIRFILPYAEGSKDVIIVENLVCEWPQVEKRDIGQHQAATQVSDINEEQLFSLSIDELRIKSGSLNFVIGKIGSGKTALFNAILNELRNETQFERFTRQSMRQSMVSQGERMFTISDQIIIKGGIAYCAQSSWVQNATIRQNILFGKEFQRDFYNQVLEVCEITKDLSHFAKRDLHEVGPDGKNLSGGQKQRISLARAIYQDADIYLFDDVFSSLDVHVADSIFQKAILQFLIQRGKTVLLITSHYRYLKQVPSQVPRNIILLNNGTIEHDSVKIEEFILQQTKKEIEEDEQEKLIEEELEETLTLVKRKSSTKQESVHSNSSNEDMDELEVREQGKINLETWKIFLSTQGWLILVFYFTLNFAMEGGMALIDFWLKGELSDSKGFLHQITVYFDNDLPKALIYLTLLALTITFVRGIFYVSANLKQAWTIFKRLNHAIIYSTMKFYNETNLGRIVNRIQDDTYMIDDELPWTFHVLLENASRVFGLSVGLVILFPEFLAVLAGVIYLYYKISLTYFKPNCELKRLKSANNGVNLQIVNETLSGIKTIRAFNKQQVFLQNFISKLNNWIITDQCSERAKYWFSVRLNLMSNLILVCVVLLILVMMLIGAEEFYPSCALALTYSLVVLESCFDLFVFYLRLETCVVSIERVSAYFKNPLEVIDRIIGSDHEISQNTVERIWKKSVHVDNQEGEHQAAIIFKNIFLTYDDPMDIKQFALKNVNLTIAKGEKIAFVGRTGSGKTSILNVLFGLYKHSFGSIIINGKNISQMSLRELRQEMSVVPQFGFLYNASVKENLDPLNLSSLEEIKCLFKNTGFKLRGISDDETDVNVEFIVQQNGGNLSNGEKQVLNFLRIMLMNKSIVCLDEATSNMDPETDQRLHDLLFEYASGKTLLVITHRLENIKIYDKIVVMEQGEIVEYGSYSELSSKEGGFFYKLIQHHKQFS